MTKDEYEQWKHHPLTEKFHQFLCDYRQGLMNRWAEGEFSLPDLQAAAVKNLEAMAKCQCYKDLVELDADFISQWYSKGESGAQAD